MEENRLRPIFSRGIQILGYQGLIVLLAISLTIFLIPKDLLADPPISGGPSSPAYWWNVGDPISVSSGAYSYDLPLLRMGGPLPLNVALSYRTDNSWFGVGIPWGNNVPYHFRHPFFPEISVEPDGDITRVSIETMRVRDLIRFDGQPSSGGTNWVLVDPSPTRYVLSKTAAGYFWLMDPVEERIYIFEPNSGAYPYRILAYMDRNENRWTYTYSKTSSFYPATPSRLEDGLGRSLQFNYDPLERMLIKTTDHAGRTILYAYVNFTYYTSVADPMGQTTRFSFDNAGPFNGGVLTQVQRPRGNIPYRQTYASIPLNGKSQRRATTQTDAFGNIMTLAYDSAINKVTTTAPDQTIEIFESYGNSGPIGAITDQIGKKMTFTQTPQGQTSGVTDRLGRTTTYTYHAESGKVASVTNAKGKTITFTYARQTQTFANPALSSETVSFSFYNLTKIDYPDKTSEQFTYDGKGNLLSRKDQTGAVTNFTYNNHGQVLTAENSTGGVVTYTYNGDGTLASRSDTDTGTTTFQYDNYKRPNRVNLPDGTFRLYAYNLNDQVTSMTDELGRTTTFFYDANGNLTQVTDAAGKSVQYAYDQMDRLISTTNRLGKTSTYAYDVMERLASITDPAGASTSFSYDPRGWRNEITQGDQSWMTVYNDEGGVTSITTPMGETVQQSVDAVGLWSGFTYPTGGVTTIGRDDMNKIVRVTDPLNRAIDFGYDEEGFLSDVTLPVIGTADYYRNDLGGLIKITDLNGKDWGFTRTPMGRVSTAADPLGRTRQYAYDSRGRLNQSTFPGGETVAISRDGRGNPTRFLYSNGPDLHHTYDALNRITDTEGIHLIYDDEGRIAGTEDSGVAFGVTRDSAGRAVAASYANGAFSVNYAYDGTKGLLTSVSDTLTGSQVQFTYDADQRLTGIDRSNGIDTILNWNASSWLTRIQDLKSGSSPLIDIQYALNAAGQVTGAHMTVPLDPGDLLVKGSNKVTYDGASQVSSTGFTYDQRGRLTADAGQSYTWDGASRLTATGNATLTYNGLNDIRTRTSGGKTTHYYHNYALEFGQIVAEKDEGSGQFSRYYVWTPGGKLLYMIDAANGNKVYFYHFDRVGSTLALTDGSGNVTDAYACTPYGALIGHQGTNVQPFTYAGRFGVRQEDASAGSGGTLFQMGARYYDALTGRFLSREPFWPNLSDPRQINPYAYALNNPANYIDATGTGPYLLPGQTWIDSVFTHPVNTVNGMQYPEGYNGPHLYLSASGTWIYSTPPPPVPPRPPVASGIPIVQSFCGWTAAAAKAAIYQLMFGNQSTVYALPEKLNDVIHGVGIFFDVLGEALSAAGQALQGVGHPRPEYQFTDAGAAIDWGGRPGFSINNETWVPLDPNYRLNPYQAAPKIEGKVEVNGVTGLKIYNEVWVPASSIKNP